MTNKKGANEAQEKVHKERQIKSAGTAGYFKGRITMPPKKRSPIKNVYKKLIVRTCGEIEIRIKKKNKSICGILEY